ncbi:helix-turn-helix domain-containing protein, partial [Periweissella ghanensis]|uniref:helix-turn-helix domain-containing protein n=1 Tax=Periweissella ghanensis TaxID=467997 RepID=UPI001E3EF8C6
MNKLVLYQDIQRLAAKGYSQRTIAEKLAISRNTVSKYLKKDEGQLLDWLAETRTRSKKIDSYESQILIWLTESPDLSGAQIYDWLEEKYGELPFGEQTLRRNVKLIREKFNIRKKKKNRQYQTLPDLPMGYQAQLDFGQTKQKTYGNGEVTLYVVAMVLSHSRYKWAKWQTRPF